MDESPSADNSADAYEDAVIDDATWQEALKRSMDEHMKHDSSREFANLPRKSAVETDDADLARAITESLNTMASTIPGCILWRARAPLATRRLPAAHLLLALRPPAESDHGRVMGWAFLPNRMVQPGLH